MRYILSMFTTYSHAVDDNHKPELALALTPFQAMCGFLPLTAIALHLSNTPELATLIPETILKSFISLSSSATPTGPAEKAALRDLFSALMTADENAVKRELDTLVQRYRITGLGLEEGSVEALALRLNAQFPGDIGVFCAFLLNHVTLEVGEAIFLGAGEPHAYVSGGKHLTFSILTDS